ncbi:alpha/beta hydrolase fold domain-containing protein [Halobaculum sp. WSA2]|uniref:Alpha/beta hydrolase fold domain-containing protein n=1 Tax=Halobaculum saliterrae TaxID=2073113 RepID=A0A6B0T1Q2_9EURY|nr:alpha/beta hydrolase [Halobaculum saliterrae]MXR42200.1 alpha/beta hydrolase fold domain-containing protein [Halobaculum saliterrae]
MTDSAEDGGRTERLAGLDPELREVVAEVESLGVPPWHALSVESARRIEDELFGGDDGDSGSDNGDGVGGDGNDGGPDATLPVASTLDLAIDGPEGPGNGGEPDGDLPIRVYRPAETPAPTLVFLHGGGWCLGTLDSADDLARRLCRRVGAVVVSVDYRLAPEHPFPAAVDDAIRALRWTREHAAEFGGTDVVGVAGSSAGGTLAAAASLATPDGEAPAVQTLLYPITDRDFGTDSYEANADGPLLTRADMRRFWREYLRSDVDAANPYAAPLRTDEAMLAESAPAVVVTGEHDPLRDDGAAYAARLADAGVDVDHLDYEGMCHGFLSFADEVAVADAAFDDLAAATRERLAAADDADRR